MSDVHIEWNVFFNTFNSKTCCIWKKIFYYYKHYGYTVMVQEKNLFAAGGFRPSILECFHFFYAKACVSVERKISTCS